MKTKVPSIPLPTQNNLYDVARAIKGILDVREGYIGDPLDQNVTYRDLITSGVAQLSKAGVQGIPSLPPIEIPGIVGGYNPATDYTPPDIPTGLTVTSGKTLIKLKWDLWTSQNHAYAEVWRSTSNAIGSALLIGTSDTQYYVDSLGETGAAYYYWIRFVSQANQTGPYNSTNGTTATSGLIDNADIANLDAAKITTGFLSANRIQAGSLDAKIANLDAAVITSGYIAAARINTASIANASISTAQIASATITAAQIASGFIDAARINTASIANAQISNAQITSLDAAKITSGYINAARIQAASINADMIVSASATSFQQSNNYCAENTWVSFSFFMHHDGYVSIIATGMWNQSGSGGDYSYYVGIGPDYETTPSYWTGGTGSWYSSAAPSIPTMMISNWCYQGWNKAWLKLHISTATAAHYGQVAIFKSYR
jgi:hypothetical protein